MTAGIGQLNERVTLERPERTADGLGGWTVGWRAVATVWAGVAADPRGETGYAGKPAGQTRWRITLRRRADIGLDWRLRWKTIRIGVTGWATPDDRPDMMVVLGETEPIT